MTTPVLPAALRHRPMTPDDAAGWADVVAAAEEVDRTGEHYSAADLAEELTDPGLDLEHDSVVVLDGDRFVACLVLRLKAGGDGSGGDGSGGDGARDLEADGVVHPDHRRRGIGTALVALARDRAADLGATLHLRLFESVPGSAELAAATGLLPVRWWSDLRRDLSRPVEPVAAPDGLELHPLGPGYDAARWDEPLLAVRNASFAEHWGSRPETLETFVHRRTGSRAFRSECSAAVTTPDGQITGFVLCYEHDADTERTGSRDLHVATVGTLAPWRGRGIAAAMLAHALGSARDLGFGSSTLTVDTENATGALGVYARVGYEPLRRSVTYVPGT